MKYGYKVVRTVTTGMLMELCVQKGWYTHGDIAEFVHMLDVCKKMNITSDDIVETATDIIEHSNLSFSTDFISVCNDILKISLSYTLKCEENESVGK